ncbi:MAG: ATP-binding protein [Bacillota bacterium]
MTVLPLRESGVNYKRLIQDLAEMYPYDVAEVVVVELIANSLDAGATTISVDFDPTTRVLVVADDGAGMTAEQFDRYHDFAAGLKDRGSGIGFAGLGAKISFNVADRVITETRSSSFSGASDWHFAAGGRLVWEEVEPTRLVGQGTRVEVHFRGDDSIPYGGRDDLVRLVRRHYLPLHDSDFLRLYDLLGKYSAELRFCVDGRTVEPTDLAVDLELSHVKRFLLETGGKAYGYGMFGLAASDYPVDPDMCGVFICTHGKVVKAELFNQLPGDLGPRIFGLVEIPELIHFLTTSKTDFNRKSNPRRFELVYGPVRDAFKGWLREIGIRPPELIDAEEARRLQRELAKVLEEVPELQEFLGFRSKRPVLQAGGEIACARDQEGVQTTFRVEGDGGGTAEGPQDLGSEPGQPLVPSNQGAERAKPISRVARAGPKVGFVEAPERIELGWVEGNSVIINTGHPSYAKVRSNPVARITHSLFAIATAVQRFLGSGVDPPDLLFVDRLMNAWGRK